MSFFRPVQFRWKKLYRRSEPAMQLGDVRGGMHRICVAANPAYGDAGAKYRWLVTDNGETRGASEVVVNTGFDPSTDMQGHEVTAVYVCLGRVSWRGSIAEIN